jgi:hypothetical protein
MDNPRSYFNELWLLDTEASTWTLISPNGIPPSPRYSHTATPLSLGDRMSNSPDITIRNGSSITHTLVAGGNSPLALNDMFLFDIENQSWSSYNVTHFGDGVELNSDSYHRLMFTRHSVTQVEDRLYFIGGGALCFSFGSHFNSLHILRINALTLKTPILSKPVKKVTLRPELGPLESRTPIPIELVSDVTYEKFMNEISPRRRPVILRNVSLGQCVGIISSLTQLKLESNSTSNSSQ